MTGSTAPVIPGRWSQTRVGFPRLLALGLETRERRGEERSALACVKFVMLMSIAEIVMFAVQVESIFGVHACELAKVCIAICVCVGECKCVPECARMQG